MTRPDRIIYPFRGIHYDIAKEPDLSLLIAPPFDVISPEMQDDLYARDEHNFVRLELPRGDDEDETDGRYTRAVATLRSWLDGGVLICEQQPALYVVETEFALWGSTWRRRGVFALVRLPEEGEDYVLGHEATFAGPKADRLRLMVATRAMISPVMAMCKDASGSMFGALTALVGPPDAEAVEGEGTTHRLWVLQDGEATTAIGNAVGAGPLYILDGHHRFETARLYRDEMRRQHPRAPRDAGFNFALMLLVSAQDEGVKVRSSHRLVSGLGLEGMEWTISRLIERFHLHPRPVPDWDWLDDLLQAESHLGRHVFAYYCADGNFAFLSAKEELLAQDDSPVARLDVTVLHRALLDPMVRYGLEETAPGGAQPPDGRRISYEADARKAAAAVSRGECDFAFFLRPTGIEEVMAVAGAGQRMPRKATYFYPKIPAGLVISDASVEPI